MGTIQARYFLRLLALDRPGVMARLNLGYDTLREMRPGLVYCAISGFGQDGPLDRVTVPSGGLRVERHGFVDDLVAAAPQARIAVAPVVSGGGIRIKNLLLAALGKAVVTTPLGNEGIGFVDGHDAVLCEDGRAMAARINALAVSPQELARLGANAAASVRDRFGPEAILDQFDREVLA